MTQGGKILIWTAAIGILAIGGYMTYASIQKRKEEEAASKPKISIEDAKSYGAGLGSFFSSLFAKKTTTSTTGLDYQVDVIPGVTGGY